MDFRLEAFMRKHLPKDKKEFSKDAVEILLKLLWDDARKAEKSDSEAERFEDQHGVRY